VIEKGGTAPKKKEGLQEQQIQNLSKVTACYIPKTNKKTQKTKIRSVEKKSSVYIYISTVCMSFTLGSKSYCSSSQKRKTSKFVDKQPQNSKKNEVGGKVCLKRNQ
jgi:hypothetical protein